PMLLHTLNNFGVFGLRRWGPNAALGGLFAPGEVYLPLFLAALAALAGLGFDFYQTRLRWALPHRPLRTARCPTAELPPSLRWAWPGLRGGSGLRGAYLLFGGACAGTGFLPPALANGPSGRTTATPLTWPSPSSARPCGTTRIPGRPTTAGGGRGACGATRPG